MRGFILGLIVGIVGIDGVLYMISNGLNFVQTEMQYIHQKSKN